MMKDKVNAIIKEILRDDELVLTEGQHMIEDLGLTSLNLTQLIGAIEDEFDIIIPQNKVIEFETMGQLYSALQNPNNFLHG